MLDKVEQELRISVIFEMFSETQLFEEMSYSTKDGIDG